MKPTQFMALFFALEAIHHDVSGQLAVGAVMSIGSLLFMVPTLFEVLAGEKKEGDQ